MRVIYVADDGKEFDNEYDCERYEDLQHYPSQFTIDFYDDKDRLYHLQPSLDDKGFDEIYQKAEKVIIHNQSEFEALAHLTNIYGWCEFDDITGPGTWVRKSELGHFYDWFKED
jgi:hypothetical protein